MTRLVLSELFVTNLRVFEHQQKELLVSFQLEVHSVLLCLLIKMDHQLEVALNWASARKVKFN